MKAFLRPLLTVLFILTMLYNVFAMVSQQNGKYLATNYWQRYPDLERVYLSSQYVNPHATAFIPDDTIFAYTGGAYIKGVNPILINPDAPPLGKYIIGLSALLFGNEHLSVLVFGILSLAGIYLLSVQVIKDKVLAFLPALLFSFEPMFKNQFIFSPAFDLFQLFFLLLYFYFINNALFGNKKTILFFILANVFFGFFISTKFFVSGIPIFAATVIVLLLHFNKRRMIQYAISLPLVVIVLILSYGRIFFFGYNLLQFFGIQKWILLYHKSQIIFPFSAWDLLLFNRWHVWFGNKPIISDSQWIVTWPTCTILSLLTAGLYIRNKIEKHREVEILIIWAICYMGLLSFGQIFSRYFIILLPILYIISFYGIIAFSKKYFIHTRPVKNTKRKK